jgi:cell division protein FtsI (penicillin-binding protein 3)
MPQDRAHARLLVIVGVALLWVTAVFGRLTYLQLFRHAEFMARAQRQQQRTIEITPRRGAIYDRNKTPLAMSIPVDSAFAVPAELADEDLAARLLSGIVNVPLEVLETRFQSSRSFVWIARKLPPEKAEAINQLNLKGVYLQKENQRFYPKRDLAAHVLGFVDLDEKGQAGIEYELDKQIRGQSEKIVVMADAKQRWFDGAAAKRERGADVYLTLDEKIQYIAERELGFAMVQTHALAGTVIVMNPNNGEILALANFPRFNPNKPGESSGEARMNRAVSAMYEPGSTFKVVTLAAALNEGITRPEEVFDCENGRVYVAGHRIRDHKPFGMLSVAQILAESSDVGAIKVALRLQAPKFYDYIRAFGFGEHTGIELPWESGGSLMPLRSWHSYMIGPISMGQGVGVTPVQLVTAISAIANGGLLYKPKIVAEVRRGDRVVATSVDAESAEPRQVIRPETAATMRQLLEGVVLHGTGPRARLDGWTSAGKTGSAQKIDPATGRYSTSQLVASFTGFAPINDPAVAILVSLDSVGHHEGGEVAAPVFKRIAEQVLAYLDVPRDVPLNPKLIETAFLKRASADPSSLEDLTAVDFSGQPDPMPAESQTPAAGVRADQHAQDKVEPLTAAVDQGRDIEVPDFTGKTMREVTDICLKLRLEPVLVGSGLALEQVPALGAKLRRGTKVTVSFGAPATQKSRAALATRN